MTVTAENSKAYAATSSPVGMSEAGGRLVGAMAESVTCDQAEQLSFAHDIPVESLAQGVELPAQERTFLRQSPCANCLT